MSAPPIRRASPSSGLPSVQPWFLRYAVLIGVLFSVATSAKDLCPNNQADFPKVVHTIGQVHGHLWAITTDNWTVYELTPCNYVYPFVPCMEVGLPVSIDSKWPELAKSIKESVNVTDFNFTVDNSVIGYSSKFHDTILAMHVISSNVRKYFGFRFGANTEVPTVPSVRDIKKGLWISSGLKDKTYILFDFGAKINYTKFDDYNDKCVIEYANDTRSICQSPLGEVVFSNTSCENSSEANMNWTVVKGVNYHGNFYFFALDKVYIFSSKAEFGPSKVQVMQYADFLQCKATTTTPAPTSTHSNGTTARTTQAPTSPHSNGTTARTTQTPTSTHSNGTTARTTQAPTSKHSNGTTARTTQTHTSPHSNGTTAQTTQAPTSPHSNGTTVRTTLTPTSPHSNKTTARTTQAPSSTHSNVTKARTTQTPTSTPSNVTRARTTLTPPSTNSEVTKTRTTLPLRTTHSKVTKAGTTLRPFYTPSKVTKGPRITVTSEHTSTTVQGMKPSTILIYVILGIAVLLVIGGVGYYLYPKKNKSTMQITSSGGTKDNARFPPKNMSPSKAKASSVVSSVASKVGPKISSKT